MLFVLMVGFELAAELEAQREKLPQGRVGWTVGGFADVVEGGLDMAEPGVRVMRC
jgi:hypothetical protein